MSVEEVDADRVFLAGHSEGGVLALMAATTGSDIAGLILLSSPGYPMHQTLRLQMEAQGDAAESIGLAGMKEKILTALDDLYEAIRTGKPFDYSIYGLPQELASVYLSLEVQREFVEGMLFADPAEMARQVNVPVCIIQGTADTQVGVDNASALADAVGDKVEIHIIEGVDHVLKPTAGEPLPYGDPSRRVSPEVLEAIERFVSP
jgi:pimeloyl-ACP methyl ester carboxylesterase